MSIQDFLTGEATKLVNAIFGGLDDLFTSDEERLKAKATIEKRILDYNSDVLKYTAQEDAELSKRHSADMMSDSWLSKNIRPISLLAIISLYTIFSVLSGNVGSFKIDQTFSSLLGQWGMVVMSFYFGGRTVEKFMSMREAGKAIRRSRP